MISGLDHVAAPMQAVDAMLAFYRRLGGTINEEYFELLYSMYFGNTKLSFHTPELWQDGNMTLRGRTALPSSGGFCFVQEGSQDELSALLDGLDADFEDGPVERTGGLGQGALGMSVYTRDPDHSLVEFTCYRTAN